MEHWENMILQLVRASVIAVGDDEWSVKLGNAFIQSAPLYSGDEATKKMLLSIIGLGKSLFNFFKFLNFSSHSKNKS